MGNIKQKKKLKKDSEQLSSSNILNLQDQRNEYYLRKLKLAYGYARRCGANIDQCEEFAQYAALCMFLSPKENRNLGYLWVDFLRQSFGRSPVRKKNNQIRYKREFQSHIKEKDEINNTESQLIRSELKQLLYKQTRTKEEALILRLYFEGFTSNEIAKMLNHKPMHITYLLRLFVQKASEHPEIKSFLNRTS